MKYQFCIDGRAAAPVRKSWIDAAYDAVNAGYATWQEIHQSIYLDSNMGASLERIDDANLAA